MLRKIKIDYGEWNEILEMKFNSEIEAAEFCEKMTGETVKYSLISDKKLKANRGD